MQRGNARSGYKKACPSDQLWTTSLFTESIEAILCTPRSNQPFCLFHSFTALPKLRHSRGTRTKIWLVQRLGNSVSSEIDLG